MNRKLLFLLTIISCLTCYGQADWSNVEIQSIKLNNKINYLVGRGGNIGVLHGEEGVMIVDDQYAPLSEKIKAALSSLSPSSLKFIVNSHYHGDHTGGNENLSEDGASIVAHANVRKRLGLTFYNSILDRNMEAKSESYWPTITFKEEISFHLNDEEIQIRHVPNAHTDGDVLVFFKTSNVIHAGDLFVRYGYPFIDISAGGSIDGMIRAQEEILAMSNETTKIIPGHGEACGIEEVIELKTMLEETRNIIADLKNQNKTLDDCLSESPLTEYHERWSGEFIDSDLFIREIYETLK